MALTQQQLDATRKYKAGEITSDQYKQAYVTNYDPTKDRTAGKNIAYSGTSSPEAIRIQENSQALIDAMQPKPAVPVQPVPQMVQPVQAPKTDYLGMISSQYGESTNAAVNKLKQAIAESKAKQQGIITSAPKQFDPLRSQSELAKGQQLRSVLERNSLMGDRGGVGRQAALQTQTTGENRLNSINLQQQQVIDTANAEIANLESRGLYEEANIRSQQKLAELQALMAESQRQDEIARRLQETLDTRAYNEGLTADEISREDAQTTADQTRQDFINTIGGIRDYSAQISNVQNDGDESNDWQIPFLQQAKQEKIVNQNLDPRTGKPLPVDNTQQVWDAAYKKWNAGIPLTQQEMQVIGATSAVKPTKSSSGSSSGATYTGGTTPSPTDPPKKIISYVELTLRGTSGSQAADAITEILNTGVMDNLTPAEVKSLMNKFGVTDEMAEQADNRYEAKYYGVELPSGKTLMPTR